MGWDGEYVEEELEQYRDEEEPDYRDEFTERYADVPSREHHGVLYVGARAPESEYFRCDITVRFGGEDDVFTVLDRGTAVDKEEYDQCLEPR